MLKELYLCGIIVTCIMFIGFLLFFMYDFRQRKKRILISQYEELVSKLTIIILILLFITLILMCVNYGIQLSY